MGLDCDGVCEEGVCILEWDWLRKLELGMIGVACVVYLGTWVGRIIGRACVKNLVYLRAWIGRIVGRTCVERLGCLRIRDLETVLALLFWTGMSAGTFTIDVGTAFGSVVKGRWYRLIRGRAPVVRSRSNRS